MFSFIKIVTVPHGQPIESGFAHEVQFASDTSLINSGRQAYARLYPTANVITQQASKQEHLDYAAGRTIKPNAETRTVAQLAQANR